MTTENKMLMSVFISTGELNAMFTLRVSRTYNGFYMERYIKNLSTDFNKAERLALEYTESLRERVGSETCEVVFVGADVDELYKRRGKLSVRETQMMEQVEAGEVPFGKHRGSKIVDLPDTYVLWLTDKLADPELSPVFYALATVASGIAFERNLLEKREQKREERRQRDSLSTHFGEIGSRYEEDVFVEFKKEVRFEDYFDHFKYQLRIGDQILTHKGKIDLPQGSTIRMKFTVKFHYGDDVKKTYVNRPKIVE